MYESWLDTMFHKLAQTDWDREVELEQELQVLTDEQLQEFSNLPLKWPDNLTPTLLTRYHPNRNTEYWFQSGISLTTSITLPLLQIKDYVIKDGMNLANMIRQSLEIKGSDRPELQYENVINNLMKYHELLIANISLTGYAYNARRKMFGGGLIDETKEKVEVQIIDWLLEGIRNG
jgi:hypothetical protein